MPLHSAGIEPNHRLTTERKFELLVRSGFRGLSRSISDARRMNVLSGKSFSGNVVVGLVLLRLNTCLIF